MKFLSKRNIQNLHLVVVAAISLALLIFIKPGAALESGDTLPAAVQQKWLGDYDGMLKRQVIRHKLADMAPRLAAARALTGEAITRFIAGENTTALAAMAKNSATDMCSWVADQAVQIHGGYGYSKEYAVERMYRDARVNRIYEGTSEIQRLVIARDLIKKGAY